MSLYSVYEHRSCWKDTEKLTWSPILLWLANQRRQQPHVLRYPNEIASLVPGTTSHPIVHFLSPTTSQGFVSNGIGASKPPKQVAPMRPAPTRKIPYFSPYPYSLFRRPSNGLRKYRFANLIPYFAPPLLHAMCLLVTRGSVGLGRYIFRVHIPTVHSRNRTRSMRHKLRQRELSFLA